MQNNFPNIVANSLNLEETECNAIYIYLTATIEIQIMQHNSISSNLLH